MAASPVCPWSLVLSTAFPVTDCTGMLWCPSPPGRWPLTLKPSMLWWTPPTRENSLERKRKPYLLPASAKISIDTNLIDSIYNTTLPAHPARLFKSNWNSLIPALASQWCSAGILVQGWTNILVEWIQWAHLKCSFTPRAAAHTWAF